MQSLTSVMVMRNDVDADCGTTPPSVAMTVMSYSVSPLSKSNSLPVRIAPVKPGGGRERRERNRGEGERGSGKKEGGTKNTVHKMLLISICMYVCPMKPQE